MTILMVNKSSNFLDLLPKMLDDMMKLFVDPVFKPKYVPDPDRENLFELIYSPGNTINSRDKINQRRKITWSDLYLTEQETKEFLNERLPSQKLFSKVLKIRANKSVNRTPK